MTDQAPTTPDTVVVPLDPTPEMITKGAWRARLHREANPGDSWEDTARETFTIMLAARRPAATPGGEREDSAFKIASDLHAAYEQLIYGLPKYLEAENLTDEENMIREAYITLDVTAHRLAALSRPAPVAGEARQFRHRQRGATYTLIGVGRAQGEMQDDDPVVLYRGQDGGLWVRHQAEFSDGRFEEVEATPTPQPAAARGGEDMDWQSVAMWMGFAASAIKSGEAWSAQCQQHYDEAKAAFARLNAPALSAKGGS